MYEKSPSVIFASAGTDPYAWFLSLFVLSYSASGRPNGLNRPPQEPRRDVQLIKLALRGASAFRGYTRKKSMGIRMKRMAIKTDLLSKIFKGGFMLGQLSNRDELDTGDGTAGVDDEGSNTRRRLERPDSRSS